jgi:hypothetical protein
VWSLTAWAVVGLLGLLRVDLNGAVLAVLSTAELIVIIILTVTGLTKPAAGHYSAATLSPTILTKGGIGAALAISVAVIVFLARDRRGESLWSALIAPVLSAAALAAMVWLVVDNYATLLGVAPGSALAWIFPATFAAATAAGIAWP